jgi:hypothetical protein
MMSSNTAEVLQVVQLMLGRLLLCQKGQHWCAEAAEPQQAAAVSQHL